MTSITGWGLRDYPPPTGDPHAQRVGYPPKFPDLNPPEFPDPTLAVLLDLYSRRVVGWALRPTLSRELCLAALRMALRRRRPAPGLIHHTDRGCQYASREYRNELAEHGIASSMSRAGDCWDNAVAESFFATLKKELVHGCAFATRTEAYDAIYDYIENFYNPERRHSSNGFVSPIEFEMNGQVASAA